MAEEIDVEKCNFEQFLEIQKPLDLDFDLRSGQGRSYQHAQ